MSSNLNKLDDFYDLDNKIDNPEMIRARIKAQNPSANLGSYYDTCRNFSWQKLEDHFESVKSGSTNIVFESVDRWTSDERMASKSALEFAGGCEKDCVSYSQLREYSCQMANMLISGGLKKGDRLFILLDPCLELYLMMLACARVGIIFSVIDRKMGFDALDYIFKDARPKAVLADYDTASLLSQISCDSVESGFIVGSVAPGVFREEIMLAAELDNHDTNLETAFFPPETPLFIVYVSGSTTGPKGIVHSHKMMMGAYATAKYVLDLKNDSISWSDADPSSLVGVVYGCFAPLLCGATAVNLGIPFSAPACYLTLERRGVTAWLTNPRRLELLKQEGDDSLKGYDFSKLSNIVSAGKNLTAELFYWVRDKFRIGPHDSWVMTEAGMICIANYPSEQIKLGAMGKPFPGLHAAIIDEYGEELPLLTLGELAFKAGWPSMMSGIWSNEARTDSYYREGWFLTGDLALKDEDGYYYHHGRLDDLLRIGCRFVGPYLIENVILKHPAVDEVAVILKKNRNHDAMFKAYVKVKDSEENTGDLSELLISFVKESTSDDIPLGEIEFVEGLPKSSTGNVLRRVLTARDLGLPSGDYTRLSDCKLEI